MGENAKIKLNSIIPHFRHDIYWPSWIYLEIESRRIFQNSQRLLKQDKIDRMQNRPSGAQLLQQSMFGDWNIINEKVTGTLPAFIRTGESYFRNAESNVAAMVNAFGLPQLFVTLTFSESWPDFRCRIERALQFLNSFTSRPQPSQHPLPTDFPWEAVEFYYERIYHFRRYFLSIPSASGYRRLRESVMRFEFQLRQAIHTHMLLWVERSIPELIQCNYIRADVPDPVNEKQLYDLVIAHQIHTCQLHLCGKPPKHDNVNDPCKKGFPQPLSMTCYHPPGELRYRYARFKPTDQYVVPYNPRFLLIWKAHINVQYVTSEGLTKYVTKYVTKSEPISIVNLPTEDRVKAHIQARRIGAMEIMCLLNSKPIIKLSSGVAFLPNSMPEIRTLAIRPAHEIERDPENPYYPDSIEKYFNRPQDPIFDNLSYSTYFSQFVLKRRRRRGQISQRQRLSASSTTWRDRLGNYVYPRKRLQVTRSPFRRLADGEPFFYALLLEKRPWRSDQEILGPSLTYRDRFMCLYPEQYRDIIDRQQLGRHTRELSLTLLYDEIVTMIVETIDISINDIVACQLRNLRPSRLLHAVYQDDEYDPVLHMGQDQYEAYSMIMDAINHRRSVVNHRLFFITGSAGTGKSFVLSSIERTLQLRHIPFLKLAPTGIAAVNIGGQTIHSALSITTSGTGSKSTSFITSIHRSQEKMDELRKIEVLLLDEMSMVSSELLSFVSTQFSTLHNTGRPFGGIMVVAFGDLLQLPPVAGLPVYRSNLWSLFFPLFLTASRRQREDAAFVKLLDEVRVGKISDQSWALLERLHQQFTIANTVWQSTFIVARRDTAHTINDFIAQSLSLTPIICSAIDCEGDRVLNLSESAKSFKQYTNLPEEVNLCVGGRVMFLDNSLICNGISNGTTGVITEIIVDDPDDPRLIHPIVVFPTENGAEVPRLHCLHLILTENTRMQGHSSLHN